MIELTPTAQTRLNDYLRELRHVLSRSSSVDPFDVERDVRDHIDAALTGQTPPVEASALDDVLRKLGSPAQWLPEGAGAGVVDLRRHFPSPGQLLSALKQAILEPLRRIAGGPESYRLAYLSFLLLAGAWCLTILGRTPAPLMMAIPVSFILSRAALALFGAERLTGGQKWLLYPSLVLVDLPLAALIVLAPFLAAGIFLDMHRGGWPRRELFYGACGLGFCVSFGIALGCALFPGAIRGWFHPFAGWFSRRIGVGVAVLGLIALVVVGTMFYHAGSSAAPSTRRAAGTRQAVWQTVPARANWRS